MERYPVLAEEPGPAHALDVKSTREGDPWRPRGRAMETRGRRMPYFYGHDGPQAACGVRVRVAMGMEFDAADPDACPKCAELVESGEAWGRWARPHSYVSICSNVLRMEEDDEVEVYSCVRLAYHDESHRSSDGATWERGPDTFIPAPDGFV